MKQEQKRPNILKNIGIFFKDLGQYGKNAWTGVKNVFGKVKEAISQAHNENKERNSEYSQTEAQNLHNNFTEQYSGYKLDYEMAQKAASQNAEERKAMKEAKQVDEEQK